MAAEQPADTSRARITEVAELAGVSIKTVSRVMNDEPGVRASTRERVEEAVRTLRYVPNSFAKLLKTGGGSAIGVVIDAISDQFFATLVGRVEELAAEQGMAVLFASTGVSITHPEAGVDVESARAQLRRMRGNHVRGIILAPVPGLTDADFAHLGCPVVCIDRGWQGIDSVIVDDAGATREAVAQFIAHGHRRIGLVGVDPRFTTNQHRVDGYRDALEAAGLPFEERLTIPNADADAVAAEVVRLVSAPDGPTALLAVSARATLTIIEALRSAGREDVAIVSFGDFPLAGVLRPGITVVDQDPQLIASAAFQRLTELMDSPADAPREIVIPTPLVPRGSGELPPAHPASEPLAEGASR